MLWVVAYDVADDERRAGIARTLEDTGIRVQDSVFECALDALKRRALCRRLLQLMDTAADSVRWYPLCRHCEADRRGQGVGASGGVQPYHVV